MSLPIRLFFALHREGVQREARQYREMLRLSITPKMDLKYYDQMASIYEMIIDPARKEAPPTRHSPCLEMGTLEARHTLQSVMQNMKRNKGFA